MKIATKPLATFLTESAKDPRIVGFVTVTGVDVTADLRHARVYVSVMGSDAEGVVREARVPVLLVRSPMSPRSRPATPSKAETKRSARLQATVAAIRMRAPSS